MTTKKTTTKTKKTTFAAVWKTLSEIDCSDQVEQKNGFNYLSWAWALEIMMEHFPQHTRENHLNAEEYPCFFDKNGHGMVRVTVKIDDLSRTEDYPVLNYANKSIVDPDSFQVNTALQRDTSRSWRNLGSGITYTPEKTCRKTRSHSTPKKQSPRSRITGKRIPHGSRMYSTTTRPTKFHDSPKPNSSS